MKTKAKYLRADEGRPLHLLGSSMVVKADADDTDGRYEVVLVRQAGPGGDIVPHRHPWEEFYFVLTGAMVVQVGARLHLLRAGGFITIPERAVHGFRVTSDEASFLHVSMGPGATAAFADYAAAVPGVPTPDDLELLLEISARHGVEPLLPEEAVEVVGS